MMPDELKLYLITMHSEYQHDQETEDQKPAGNIFFSQRDPWASVSLSFADLNRLSSIVQMKVRVQSCDWGGNKRGLRSDFRQLFFLNHISDINIYLII